MDVEKFFGNSPYFEISIRKLYYSDNAVIRMLTKRLQRKAISLKKTSEVLNIEYKNEIIRYIENLRISKGDILIVHSSAEQLSNYAIDAKCLFSLLRKQIGDEGTLVIPAFPLYKDQSAGFDGNNIYNPKRTLCSTGLIPNIFIRQPGVVRSLFPWNTLAAQGPRAIEMMEHNLETDLAHGKGSAWEFCYRNHAKILLLGVKSSHTTTMVHVAEDILDEKWPIDGWYENKQIVLQTSQEKRIVPIRVRKLYWAKYNASWYRSHCLRKDNILSEKQIDGFNIGFIEDSKVLVDYIVDRTLAHRPFFVVPKRCYKR